jgi:hypothetical protein
MCEPVDGKPGSDQIAFDACHTTLLGRSDDASARRAFARFARDRDIPTREAFATTARRFGGLKEIQPSVGDLLGWR